jgi:hypothetical protein
MGFTNVVWESRSTAELARDLTDGPGPGSVGEAGAAWVRVADELAAVSADYDTMVERLKSAWQSQGSAAMVRKLEAHGKWLREMSLAAAANGQRAEQAAVANTEAVMSMPTVAEAVRSQDMQDMMASLAAYNGAILNGQFAEFDEASRTQQTSAATVMRQYEDAVTELAQPWLPPATGEVPPEATAPDDQSGAAGGARAGGAGGAAGVPPMPLAAWSAPEVKTGSEAKSSHRSASVGAQSRMGAMGAGGYAPMGAHGRNGDDREYESTRPAGTLEGGGEPSASVSDFGPSWQPAAQPAPFTVSNVSWGPDSALFDELVVPDEPETPEFAEGPDSTGNEFASGWAPPVIGADGQVRL